MGPRTTELLERLDQMSQLLLAVGEVYWSEWFAKDAETIRAGNFSGVDHFLGAFGGMGSVNDLIIDPRNRHKVTAAQAVEVNRLLQDLLSQAYGLAKELQQRGEK